MQEGERKLPADVTKTLGPHLCRALDHPTRRRILRILERGPKPQTLTELSDVIPTANISSISYHALVLEECGCVTVTAAFPRHTNAERCYVSNIRDDRRVTEALQATRHLDALED
jgi:DNA-binding transcriptional ArsR family regulator